MFLPMSFFDKDYYTEFDGINEYINCGNDASVVVDYTDTFTIKARIYRHSLGALLFIAGKIEGSGFARGYRVTWRDTGKFELFVRNGPEGTMNIETTAFYNVNTWYDLEFYYNGLGTGAGSFIKIDNVVAPTDIIGSNLIGTILNAEPFSIGTQGVNSGGVIFYDGFIESVSLDVNGAPISKWTLDKLNPIDEIGINNGTSIAMNNSNIIQDDE